MFYHRAVDRVGNDDDEIRHHLDKLKRNGRILQIVRKALAESEQQGCQHSDHCISRRDRLRRQCDITASGSHSG